MATPFPGQKLPASDNQRPMLVRSTFIMAGVAIPVLIARVVARIKHRGKLSWDDSLMIVSLVLALVAAGMVPHLVEAGFGRHVYHLTPAQVTEVTKTAWIINPFGFLAVVFGRVSFAVSLLILMGTERWRRWLLWFIIVTQFASSLVVVGILMFGCNPVRKYWDRQTPGACIGGMWRRAPGFVQGACHIFADLVLALMPSLAIAKMNLNKKAKIGVIFLMGLGVFNMVAACITIMAVVKAPNIKDITYAPVIPSIWGGIQIYLVITIASIPFLRPLFTGKKIFTLAYYRSLLARVSLTGRSSSDQDQRQGGDTDETVGERGGKHLQSLPHVPKDRFVTTTLRNAGPGMESETETGFDSLSTMEAGSSREKD